ncbi:NUDIX domain-containing protein [Patescibacteria group bacterium]|nr:NUDIX domain-containing protein [Patescibacteria group bacterium]
MEPTYRQGVHAYVIDNNNNFLIVQKKIYDNNQWDSPGGGIDENETLEETVLRELTEELGTSNFEILAKSPQILKYDWPKETTEDYLRKRGKHFLGQEKHQFLVRLTGDKKDIKIRESELKAYKWVPYEDLEKHFVFENQWESAKKALDEFRKTGLL